MLIPRVTAFVHLVVFVSTVSYPALIVFLSFALFSGYRCIFIVFVPGLRQACVSAPVC